MRKIDSGTLEDIMHLAFLAFSVAAPILASWLHSSVGREMTTGYLQGCIVLSSTPLQNYTSLRVISHY